MNIYIIHGDYTTKSYERLMELIDSARKKGYEVQKISGKGVSVQEVVRSQSLFDTKRLVLVEDFDLLGDKDFRFINDKGADYELSVVIYKNKTLTKTKIKKIKDIKKEESYELPKLIWSFVDSICPGNLNNCLKIFHQIIETDAVEFIFSMIARQFKDVYWSTLDGADFPGWRMSKLRTQARKFKEGQVKEIINKLAEIDVLTKTGKANLKDELDFLFITQLE